MRASSDTRSRDKAPMTAEGSQELDGHSHHWLQLPQELHRLRCSLQMCRCGLPSQETGAGEDNSWAGNEPEKGYIRNCSILGVFAQITLFGRLNEIKSHYMVKWLISWLQS